MYCHLAPAALGRLPHVTALRTPRWPTARVRTTASGTPCPTPGVRAKCIIHLRIRRATVPSDSLRVTAAPRVGAIMSKTSWLYRQDFIAVKYVATLIGAVPCPQWNRHTEPDHRRWDGRGASRVVLRRMQHIHISLRAHGVRVCGEFACTKPKLRRSGGRRRNVCDRRFRLKTHDKPYSTSSPLI